MSANSKLAATFYGADTCDHGDHPHGRCVACGKVWAEQPDPASGMTQAELYPNHTAQILAELTPEQDLRAAVAERIADAIHFNGCTGNPCGCLVGRLQWAINAEQVTADVFTCKCPKGRCACGGAA